MHNPVRLLFFFIAFIMQITQPTGATDHCANVEQIANGAYLRPGVNGAMFHDPNIANSSFIIGTNAVAVIDSGGSPEEGQALLCAIRKVTELPIAYVITTHVHPDHQLGNITFRQHTAAVFIGHPKLPQATALLGPTYVDRYNTATTDHDKMQLNDLTAPDLLVENSLKVDLGERILRITAIKQAHTNNDLIVLDESSGTLWLGDLLFSDHIPVLGGSGSVNGWLATLNSLGQISGVKQYVPGHGPVQTPETAAIALEAAYLEQVRDEVRQWIADDKPLAQALTQIGTDTSKQWPMADTFHQRNVSYMYSELEWE